MRKFFIAPLALVLLVTSALAQSSTSGQLGGTVTGADGGRIPGATITVTDNQTGRERTVVASDEGTFNIPNLEAGTYTVRISVQGFKTFTATEVKIDIGRPYTLNATLEAGNINEEVTVVAGADVINSTTAALSNTVSPRQVQELPLNGRNPLSLVSLQPGVSGSGQGTTVINGMRGSSTSYFRDGINVQDNFIRSGFVPDRPNVDDTGEFTVVTQNAGAELGYGGSVVLLETPRGTSDFHGALFIYNRNSALAANNFFNNRAGTRRPFLNRNQFGGRVGGPMPLPRFGEGGPATYRDKAFFFGAYEGFRQRQQVIANRTILTPNARQGLFTYTPTGSTTPVTVNVLQLANLPGIDPTIQARILSNLPTQGNRTDIGDQRNTTGLTFNRANNQDREAVTLRFDVVPNDRHSINFVHNYRTELLDRNDLDSTGFGVTPSGFQGLTEPTRLFLGAHVWSPTANFTNDVRAAYHVSGATFDINNLPSGFLLTVPLISSPEANFRRQGRTQQSYTIQDNATYIWGDHSIRFGGVGQFFRFNNFNFAGANIPTYTLGVANTPFILTAGNFNNQISNTDLGTANALVALLGGVVNGGSLGFNATDRQSGYVAGAPQIRNDRFDNFALYASDQWRARPNLTLNYGLRWEYYTPVSEKDGLYIQPVVQPGQTAQEAVLNPNGTFDFIGVNAGGNNAFRADKNNFGPNFNFAWSPHFRNNFLGALTGDEGRTVIRGGVRVGFVNDEYIKSTLNTLAFGEGLAQTVTLPASTSARIATGLPSFTTPTFPTFPRTYAANNALAALQGTVFLVDPDIQIQRTVEWNIGIQREIGFQSAFEIRYVGNMSNSALRTIDYNQVDIRSNGYADDFNRALGNLRLVRAERAAIEAAFAAGQITAAQRTAQLSARPVSGAFNSTVTGSQQLTFFPQLTPGVTGPSVGLLNNATIIAGLDAGTPADLAVTYAINNIGRSLFLPNPNTFVGNVLTNGGKFRYHGLQTEFRRRFSQGLYFQANYTFQKTLGNINVEGGGAAGQNRVDPFLDNLRPEIEYSRVEFDQTHVFNFNGMYELPFGRGKRWLSDGGWTNRLVGGWQVTSIIQVGSGLPINITDPRGTLNRAGRSGRQTANSSLTSAQLRDLVGVYDTPCGLFFINPAVIDINLANCTGTGRASRGFGQPTFPGQVFFSVEPGQTGNMARYQFDGPGYLNWDASIIKNIQITEGTRFQLRAEAFNVLNNVQYNFGIGSQSQNINSSTFGRLTSASSPRIVQFVGRFEF